MKTKLKRYQARLLCAAALGIGLSSSLGAAAADAADTAKASIPWSQIGAKAGGDYQGDGLAVMPAAGGARLRCVFQRLEGEATREGLWLTSTVTNGVNDRFRVTAAEVGRVAPRAPQAADKTSNIQHSTFNAQLDNTGTVQVADKLVRFTRPGVIEEYSVSMDGVRQDFIIEHPPLNPRLSTLRSSATEDGSTLNQRTGELAVRLAVSGAKVESATDGASLVLENSGRKIAYSRLHVTDATGKELTARMEVEAASDVAATRQSVAVVEREDGGGLPTRRYAQLAVLVNDADAVYPIRIDPTFSDANWISMGGIPGVNGSVSAAVVDASGNLYIGGYFTIVGDVFATNIARWNGSSWSALGSGLNGYVYALALSDTELYAGGDFWKPDPGLSYYSVAKWNGSSWAAMGSGPNNLVYALAVLGSDVYAGGFFTMAGSNSANRIAKWNGSSWSALGSGLDAGFQFTAVNTLAVSGNELYVGGEFTKAGGSPANRIAKWDGNNWTALDSGVNDTVHALAVSGGDMYAGGEFTTAGGSPTSRIAKWNGSSWVALGSGLNNYVKSLAVSGSNLYAGGDFRYAGVTSANYIAKWNGSSWTGLSSGMAGRAAALALSGSSLYVGGSFATAGGNATKSIAKWNGTNWAALGPWMEAAVRALAVSGSDLYAAGDFTKVGGIAANRIAKWYGSSWSPLGSGMSDTVNALAVSGGNLYAGGAFTNAGGTAANYIAKWDGNSWSALGTGMGGGLFTPQVKSLVVSGSDVYAGGEFTTAGDNPVNYIAKWNGSSWSALGTGMNPYGYVYALAVSGGDLYAGGAFTNAGGTAANYIAKWNGSNWSALSAGLDNYPYALAVSGSSLYAGGYFTMATNISGVVQWNGSSWSALGSGMNNSVYALAVSGSDLYAGGWFATAGGSLANRIAKWNGSSWSALGSGMGGGGPYGTYVGALAVSGSDLYAGGDFTTAGGKVSGYIARAYLPTLPTLSMLRSGTDVKVSWPSADTTEFALEQAVALSAPPSWVTNTDSVTDDGTNKTVTLPATNSAQFFRLRRP